MWCSNRKGSLTAYACVFYRTSLNQCPHNPHLVYLAEIYSAVQVKSTPPEPEIHHMGENQRFPRSHHSKVSSRLSRSTRSSKTTSVSRVSSTPPFVRAESWCAARSTRRDKSDTLRPRAGCRSEPNESHLCYGIFL